MKLVIIEPLGVEKEKLLAITREYVSAQVEIIYYDTKVTDTASLIERGKDADIIMIDTSGIRYTPDYDFVSLLVYAGSDADVCMTMVGGDIIYENGEFAFADIEEVKAKVCGYAEEMKNI